MSGPWQKYESPEASGPWAKYGARKPSQKETNPAEYDPSSPEYQAKYGATSGMSWGDKFTAGVGKSFVDTARGVGQLLGVVEQQSVDEAAARDKPLMDTGGGMVGNIAGQVAQFAVPGSYVARGGGLAARAARGAAFGAGIANTQPVTSDQTRLGNTALGAVGGAAGEAAAAGIGRAATAASDKVAPEVAKLAKRARELGIPLRVEQATGSRPLAGVSAALDSVPFSGRDASRKAQVAAWNRALSRTVGQSDTNLTTALQKAENILGARYESVLGQYNVKSDPQFKQELGDILAAAKTELDDTASGHMANDQFRRVAKFVDILDSKTSASGEIDGRAAYNVKKMLDRLEKNPDSSVAHYAGEIRRSLLSALDRSLPQDVAKSFAKTREQYGNLITLRKAVRAGAEGTVTPAKLATLKTRGDLKELADIGATFLVEPFGNSGTANRMIGAGILGGLGTGAMFDPTLAASTAVLGGTVGRTTNALMQAQPVVNYALQGSNALRRAVPYTNALLPATGAVLSQ